MAPLPASPPTPPTEIPPGPKQRRVEIPKPPQPIKQSQLPIMAKAAVSLPTEPDAPQKPQDKTPVQQTTAPPAPAAAPAPAKRGTDLAGIAAGAAGTVQTLSGAEDRGQQGGAYLRFTMDCDGKVLTARIEQSSGYDLLDQETLALIQRAQPLPKPPPKAPGDSIELVVPIEFFIHRRR